MTVAIKGMDMPNVPNNKGFNRRNQMKKIIFLILFMSLFFMGCRDFRIDEPKVDRIMILGAEKQILVGKIVKIMRITDVQINEENPKEIICIIKGYKID